MNTLTLRVFISAATVWWAASAQGAAPKVPQSCVVEEIQVEDIQVPRPADAFPNPISINKKGDVAGTVGESRDPSWRSRGFFNRNGNTTYLPPETRVDGANERGMLVGTIQVLGSGSHAFKWANGSLTLLPGVAADGSDTTQAYGINDRGLIVGDCFGFSSRACYWEGDHLTAFPLPLESFINGSPLAVNNAGVIVGFAFSAVPVLTTKCVKWVAGKLTVLPSGGSTYCQASAINNNGDIAGRVWEEGQQYRAVVWRDDVMSYLDGEPDPTLQVHDISDRGVVVGSGAGDALYWRNVKQHSLDDLPCVQQSGWRFWSANSISPAGVVGVGIGPGGFFAPYRLRRAFHE